MPWRWDWPRWPAGGVPRPCARISAALFLAGIVLFSGWLYLLALTGNHGFALLIPFGGAALSLPGWIALAADGC